MNYTKTITATVVSVFTLATLAHPVGATNQTQQSVDGLVGDNIAGVQLQVVDQGNTSNYTAGSSRSWGKPIQQNSHFRAGSVTKSFTAVTVLQLVDEGKIKLDDPISTYLPDMVQSGDAITPRMLLQHTSGLPNHVEQLSLDPADPSSVYDKTYTAKDAIALSNQKPLTNEPGTAWNYSNTNYAVLELLIEKVSGTSYAEQVQKRIITPLGLKDTYLPGADKNLPAPFVKGYAVGSDNKQYDLSKQNVTWSTAGASLISTTSDLNVFNEALIKGTLVSPTSYEAMFRIQDSFGTGYGLGMFAKTVLPCGEIVFGHNGNIPGYYTEMFQMPMAVSGPLLH